MTMSIKGIGINLPRQVEGDFAAIAARFQHYADCGFDYVELSPHGFDVILNGKLQPVRLQQVREVLKPFTFKYTVHAPNPLNLCDVRRPEMQKSVFRACIDFAAEFGAETVVYHGGEHWLDTQPDWDELMAIERKALREVGAYAKELGVQIVVENTNPHGEEIRANRIMSYALDLNKLAEQVERVDHESVGLCLDFGHWSSSAAYLGLDYIEGIRRAAPLIQHMHVHDGFLGKPPYYTAEYMYEYTFGEGDLHLPLGWGDLPYKEIFSWLKTKPAVLLLEHKPRFTGDLPYCIAQARELVALNAAVNA